MHFSHLCSNVPAVLQTEENRWAAVQKLDQNQCQLQNLVKLWEINICACEHIYTHRHTHTIIPLCKYITMFGLLVNYFLSTACWLWRVSHREYCWTVYDMFNVRTKAAGGQSDNQHDKSSAAVPLMWIWFPWENGFRVDLFIMWIWYTGWAVRADCWVVLTQSLESDSEIFIKTNKQKKKQGSLCVCVPAAAIQSPPWLWGRSPPSQTRWHWERRLSAAF